MSKPSNIAAERAVLAGLCQFGNEVYVDVREILENSCFFSIENMNTFAIISSILDDSSMVDMASYISKSVQSGYGDPTQDKNRGDYLKSLFSFRITKENFLKNCKLLKKLQIARDAMDVAKATFEELSEVNGSESITDIISKLEKPVFDFTTSISSTSSEDKTMILGDGIVEHVEYLAKEKPTIMGIPSPFSIYNEAIGKGRRRGGVYLVGARPKTGKTTFAMGDAIHVASLGIPVLFIDTEMNRKQQWSRVLAMMSECDVFDIETGAFSDNDFMLTKVRTAAERINKLPLHYRRVPGMKFNEILSIIRRWVIKEVGSSGGKTRDCLVVYDYFKLMDQASLKDMQEYQAIGFQINDLVDFCNIYDIPCSAFVQLNRDGISKDTTDTISQSDRLLWNCASVAFLKRKSREEILESGIENGNTKLIITEDQRFGPGLDDGDWVNLLFQKNMSKFTELGLRSESKKSDENNSFEITNQDEPEFTDEDFDKFDFGDDLYRKD